MLLQRVSFVSLYCLPEKKIDVIERTRDKLKLNQWQCLAGEINQCLLTINFMNIVADDESIIGMSCNNIMRTELLRR